MLQIGFLHKYCYRTHVILCKTFHIISVLGGIFPMNKSLTLHNHIYLKDENEDIYFLEERSDGLHYCILDKNKEILKKDIHLTKFLLRLDTFDIDEKPDTILKKRTYTFKIYKCINKVFSLNDMKFEYIQGSYPTHLDFNKYLDNDIQISIWIDEKHFKRCMYSYIAFLIKNIKNNQAVVNAKNRTLVKNFIKSFLDIIENSRDIYLENFFELHSEEYGYKEFFNAFHIRSNRDFYLSVIHDILKPNHESDKQFIPNPENYKKIGFIKAEQFDNNRETRTYYYVHYKSWYNLVVSKEQSNAEYSFKTLTQDIILWELYQLDILHTINTHKPTVDEDLRNVKNWKYKYLIHKVCKNDYEDSPLSASMLIIDIVKMYESVGYPYIEPSEKLKKNPNICKVDYSKPVERNYPI